MMKLGINIVMIIINIFDLESMFDLEKNIIDHLASSLMKQPYI